jgi:hypothetical protein
MDHFRGQITVRTINVRLLPAFFLCASLCLSLGPNTLSAQTATVDLEQATPASQHIEAKVGERTFIAQKIQSGDLGQGNFSWSGKLANGQDGFLSFARIGELLGEPICHRSKT